MEKIIIIGDLHFGIKGFSDDFLEQQLNFFREQLFPYMKENNINTIVQLGDFLDNRKMMNIKTFDTIVKEFFTPMKELGFKFISFLGNHDIYYSTTLNINLVKYFGDLFPGSVSIYTEPTVLDIGGTKYKLFPWIIGDKISERDIKGVDVVLGHFEIKNFEIIKGHLDEKSELSSSFFKKIKSLKRVVSGHYHIQSTDGFVMYVGTPYQINWGDYDTPRGFFVFQGHEYEFIENTVTPKHLKIKYDDSNENKLELSGFYEEPLFFNSVLELPDIRTHKVKFFVNQSKDKEYETIAFDLHHSGVTFDFINNVEISDLIGTDFKGDIDNIGGTELLFKTVNEKKPHLVPLLDKIMSGLEGA